MACSRCGAHEPLRHRLNARRKAAGARREQHFNLPCRCSTSTSIARAATFRRAVARRLSERRSNCASFLERQSAQEKLAQGERGAAWKSGVVELHVQRSDVRSDEITVLAS